MAIPVRVDELVSRYQIAEVVYRYAAAVDRRDWSMLAACYHDEAVDDRGQYSGNIAGLIDWISQRHSHIEVSTHLIGNVLIDLSGDAANVESLCLFYQRLNAAPGSLPDMFASLSSEPPLPSARRTLRGACRYLDQFSRGSQGAWRIRRRKILVDWVVPAWETEADVASRYWITGSTRRSGEHVL